MKNGLVIATEVMPNLRSVSLGVWIKCGSRFESAETVGISHFIEHLLFKGSRSRTAKQIAEAIDSVGGQLNAFTDKEYVGFYAKVVDDHLQLGFELLSDIVLNPTFPSSEVERERNVIFEEINTLEDSPQELIHDIFLESFWKDHPLGRPIAGSKTSVAAIQRPDVMRFFKNNYTACNTVVSVAGNISHRKVHQLAAKYFSGLPPGTPLHPGPPPVARTAREIRHKPNLEQTHLCLGTIAPALESRDRYAIHLLSGVLGGGVSSRLFQKIREKRGLVYTIFSSVNAYRDAGTLVIYAGTAPKSAAHVVELVLKEFRIMKERLVPAEELQRTKENIKGSLMLSLESSSSRMAHLAQQQIYFGRFYRLEEIIQNIDSVTSQDLRRLANQIFDVSYLSLAALGNSGTGDLETASL